MGVENIGGNTRKGSSSSGGGRGRLWAGSLGEASPPEFGSGLGREML